MKKIVIILMVFTIYGCGSETNKNNRSSVTSTYTKVGEILKTDLFEITVNSVEIKPKIKTGNQYLDPKSDPSSSFLIFNVKFKNIDTESRMPFEGIVKVNYNGKDYEFDSPEPIMADGYGLFFDQINPLTSTTTNIVFKIPNELRGKMYWQPGRTNELIYLGEIEAKETPVNGK